MFRRPRNHAFTLVELLVVIAIIAILMSLLLSAVNASRNAARKLICASNLRQTGLALLLYEEFNGYLPPAGIVGTAGDGPCKFFFDLTNCFNPRSGNQISWVAMILPYLEEQPLYDQFHFSRNILDQPELPQSQHIPTLLCPADAANYRVFQHPTLTDDIPFAKGNHAAFVSATHIEHAQHIPGALGGFQPGSRQGQNLRRISDGLSRTLALSEVRTMEQETDQRGAWALPWTASTVLAVDAHHNSNACPSQVANVTLYNDVTVVDPLCPLAGDYYATFAQTPNNQTSLDVIYDCQHQTSAAAQHMPCKQHHNDYLSAAPRSLHVGGVNTFMLDGHVPFISDEIDHVVFAYLVSINDGQSP